MPEGPEVQTIVNDLNKNLVGKTISDLKSYPKTKKLFGESSINSVKKAILGAKVLSVKRVGKNIIINLSSKHSLILHLMMTGQIVISEEVPKYARLSIYFKTRDALHLADRRTWAKIDLVKTTELESIQKFRALGPDVFSKDFTKETFVENIKGGGSIYTFLLNQNKVSGLGNIYVNECLYDASINPLKKVGDLNKSEINRLYKSIIKITKSALKHRGTTFSDYRMLSGGNGSYQKYLKVFQKEGEPCGKCKGGIVREKVSGRSVFYCPKCQDIAQ